MSRCHSRYFLSGHDLVTGTHALIAPDGARVSNKYCEPCANRIVAEYAEKADEIWGIVPIEEGQPWKS